MRRAQAAIAAAAPAVMVAAALAARAAPFASGQDAALATLRRLENERRLAVDVRTQPPGDRSSGADPVALAGIPGRAELVGLLRGRDVAVLLDAELREIARVATPASPTGLTVAPDGEVLVSGELGREIARYRLRHGTLVRTGTIPLGDARSVRAIAHGREGVVYVAEDHDHRLLTFALAEGPGRVLDSLDGFGLGPQRLLRTPRHLVVDYVLSHDVVVLPVDERGLPRREAAIRVHHDGPVWAVDARDGADGVLLALGGVEDHPLDRRQGSFGYVDSFLFVYRLDDAAGTATRFAAVNVSALGVVTPKVVRLDTTGGEVAVTITGYGDATLAELRWPDPTPRRRGDWPAPSVHARAFVPGTVAAVATPDGPRVFADPLLDAWVLDDGTDVRVVPVADPRDERSVDARVGEALLFTTLIAPWNRTKGSVSRFTCETCHLDGYVDGRVHHSGRDDVRVATKPLRGLANNRPLFSRALDPDLATMIHNEFRVAGLRSRHDPWFALDRVQVPWLAHLGVGFEPLTPERLRRALLRFLVDFTHRPNPDAVGRRRWTAEERRGAALFRERCEGCHEARLSADEPRSRVPFAGWERLVLSDAGPIVWARDTRERTGVGPYVHPDGTRVPSLRRLYRKRPYFTNGASRDLADVLRRARLDATGFRHDGAAPGARPAVDAASQPALLAFLDLL